jgi:hypothetical protein
MIAQTLMNGITSAPDWGAVTTIESLYARSALYVKEIRKNIPNIGRNFFNSCQCIGKKNERNLPNPVVSVPTINTAYKAVLHILVLLDAGFPTIVALFQ